MKKAFYTMMAAAAAMAVTACGHKAETTPADTLDTPVATVEEAIVAETDSVTADGDTVMTAEVAVAEVEAAPVKEDAKEKKDKNGYYTTPSGLKYKVIKEGKGKSPKATDVVTVNYEGKLTNGQVFDSSYQRGEPTSFPLNRVIPGWTEGLQLMQEGATYEFYIPYQLAYGERGGGPIPPMADLIFKVELIKVQ